MALNHAVLQVPLSLYNKVSSNSGEVAMTLLETAYTQIEQLVQRFKSLPAAERKGMNENATRQGYILPLFRTLGWNVDNVNEVSPEEKVSRGWVDFSFRIGGIPRFFLETKKASEDLNDPRWVQQAIDYAWTKSVTWALLSDFEGLRVFNAEWKETDPFRAQFLDFNLESYLTDFERLWWLSREETAAGRLEREADKVGKRIKRLPVSQHLFDDLKLWRSELYTSLHGYNKQYSPAQIDEAVLRLLNRLIFIRTAEDRDVEPPRLMPLLRELEDKRQLDKLSEKLTELFRQFDATYNSELFAPHFSEELYCDRPPLESLINGLYAKKFVRYNFNALEADVLGTAYEQYLGHVVTEVQSETGLLAAASHVDEKRAKRKSQGIYYTPAFVTRYIVQQTVSRWLDEHGYNPSTPPRILDMACGSGSFLIEAFDALDRFVANMRGQSRPIPLAPFPKGKGELPSPLGEGPGVGSDDLHDNLRRLELLTSCIFGVDKDKQAVDVARLNLMLRALHGRLKLPLLTNIYHADSLRPETWQTAFPEIMKAGGFDVIIGNPPYVRQETLGEEFKTFAQQNFETYAGTADLYIYFIEKAHKLLKPGGYFGMIVSNKWMRSNYGKALRNFLTRESALVEIVDFGELPVFENAATFPAIIITRRQPTEKQHFLYAPIKRLDFISLPEEVQAVGSMLDERALQGENWALSGDKEQVILEKMRQVGVPLGEYVDKEVFFGIKTGYNEAFVITRSIRDRLIAQDPKSEDLLKRFVVGDDVRKYHINFRDAYLICIPKGFTNSHMGKSKDAWQWFEKAYPAIAKHLKPHAEIAKKRQDQGDYWWELRACDYYAEFDKPKIVYPDIAKESRIAFDSSGLYFSNTVYFIPRDDLYLLGLLNSKLIFAYFKRIASVLGDADKGGRLRWFRQDVMKLPIRRINFTDPAEKSAHDEIVKMVEEMLGLQKQRQQAATALEDARHPLQKRIQALDKEIDARVYRLYGLTEEEIRIVEGAG
jgi:type I restriction-modification system DNA methylase subunit